MPEMDLRLPGFTYSVCGTFTINKERIQNFKEIEDSQYTYQNKLDKACFQDDIACGNSNDLTRRAASDKILHYEAFNIAKYPKYDAYQSGLASVVYKCFDKKLALLAWSEILAAQDNLLLVVVLKMRISQKKN